MFENIKEFIGRVKKGMFDKRVIATAIDTDIAVSEEMSCAQKVWKGLYEDIRHCCRCSSRICFKRNSNSNQKSASEERSD